MSKTKHRRVGVRIKTSIRAGIRFGLGTSVYKGWRIGVGAIVFDLDRMVHKVIGVLCLPTDFEEAGVSGLTY